MTAPSTSNPTPLPLPPGQFGLPWLGETLAFFRDPDFAKKRHQQYGSIFKTRLFGKPTIFLYGAAANHFVFVHENQYFSVSGPRSTKLLLGSLSLSLQTGSTHQKRRKLLAQAFMPRALASYIKTMETITARYAQRWAQQQTLAWYPELRNYTFDVAGKLLVGLDDAATTPLGHLFETWGKGLFSIPLALPWTRFGKAMRCRDRILALLEKTVCDRQQQDHPGKNTLGLLIQARDDDGNQLSRVELTNQILVLLFAGHETLTSAMTCFCLQIAQNPAVADRLRAEQQQFDPSQPPTLEQLQQMPYLEQVMKEVLRHTPPVGGGFRDVIKTCEFQGYQIPQGWSILYGISRTHQNEQVYPDATRFNPDRFDRSQTPSQQKYDYIPFGGGIRECLGKEFARLEMKLFAIHLLRRYQWSLVPGQDLSLAIMPTPKPRDNLQVHFQALQPGTTPNSL